MSMPTFFYKAKSLDGEEREGILQGENPTELAQKLKEEGFFLVSAKEINQKNFKSSLKQALDKVQGIFSVPFKEKLFFTRNLEVMVRTGVPLSRAIAALADQAKSKRLKNVLKKASDQVIKGVSLSEALAQFPDVFPSVYTETLKVGEETGKLEDSLRMLEKQMERTYTLRSQIKSSMTYPVMVFLVAILIGILMMILVVPKIKAIFEELNIELPVTTRFILGVTDFFTHNWQVTLILFFLSFVGLVFFFRSKATRKLRSKLVLVLPIFGGIVKQTNSALVLRTLAALLKAGIPIVRSLEITSGSLKNFYFKQSLLDAAQKVKKGEKLSEALKPAQKIYSPLVFEMMTVGEETGETSQVLEKLAEFYEREVNSATRALSSVIEPVLILIIGGGVGFFAVSMIQPMFSIMSGFQK